MPRSVFVLHLAVPGQPGARPAGQQAPAACEELRERKCSVRTAGLSLLTPLAHSAARPSSSGSGTIPGTGRPGVRGAPGADPRPARAGGRLLPQVLALGPEASASSSLAAPPPPRALPRAWGYGVTPCVGVRRDPVRGGAAARAAVRGPPAAVLNLTCALPRRVCWFLPSWLHPPPRAAALGAACHVSPSPEQQRQPHHLLPGGQSEGPPVLSSRRVLGSVRQLGELAHLCPVNVFYHCPRPQWGSVA